MIVNALLVAIFFITLITTPIHYKEKKKHE
jgi:hypothetical protein